MWGNCCCGKIPTWNAQIKMMREIKNVFLIFCEVYSPDWHESDGIQTVWFYASLLHVNVNMIPSNKKNWVSSTIKKIEL